MRKTKEEDVGNNNLTEVTRSKRDAAVAWELRRLLNDTDVDPWLANGGSLKFMIT